MKAAYDDRAEEYIRANGKAFVSSPLTNEEWDVLVRAARGRSFPERKCYPNAQSLAIKYAASRGREDGITYCEGYYGPLRTPHAWVAVNEKVIDLTIRYGQPTGHGKDKWPDRMVGIIPTGVSYIGVQFGAFGVIAWRNSGDKSTCIVEALTSGRVQLDPLDIR